MSNNGFVLTMQYNDDFFLPIWIRHYSKYFPKNSIYVIDHGSTHNIVPADVNRIFVPRTKGFDELDRLSMVQGIVFSLMKCYDWGVFCDSDEIILLDGFLPNKMAPRQSIFAYGFDLFKVSVSGDQRIYGVFNSSITKPLIFNHDYPGWSTGFHGVKTEGPPEISLIMGHLKYYDQQAYAENLFHRKIAYDSMTNEEKGKGIAQQWNDTSHYSNVYKQTQTVISNTPLLHDLSVIPIEWEHEINGCTVLKPPVDSYIMDLTDQFAELLDNV